MAKKKISALNEEFDSKLFALTARRYSYWVLLLISSSLFIAFLYLRYTPPSYTSGSTIKVGTENTANAVLNYQNPQFADVLALNQLAGDVELLRSRKMISRVVSKMPLAVSYFSRGKVLDFENYLTSPYTVEYLLSDSSIIGATFEIGFRSAKEFTLKFNQNGKNFQLEGLVGTWITSEGIRLMVDVNDPGRIPFIEDNTDRFPTYFVLNDPEDLVDHFIDDLQVSIYNQNAQTLRIQSVDKNAIKAADFVNTVVEEFNAYDRERKSEGSSRSIDFINETIQSIDSQLRNSEFTLENFKKTNMVIDPSKNETDLLSHINSLIDQRVLFQLDQAVLLRLEKSINDNKKLENLLPLMAGTQSDDVIKGLVEQIEKLEGDRANLRFMATEENTSIRAIDQEIAIKRRTLFSALSNAKKALEEKIASLDARIAEFRGDFLKLPGQEAELARLSRLYEVNQKFYQLLLEKKVEFSI